MRLQIICRVFLNICRIKEAKNLIKSLILQVVKIHILLETEEFQIFQLR